MTARRRRGLSGTAAEHETGRQSASHLFTESMRGAWSCTTAMSALQHASELQLEERYLGQRQRGGLIEPADAVRMARRAVQKACGCRKKRGG